MILHLVARRMDASSIFANGLVDELKAAQMANTQKTADILDTIQRVTSKKATIDKEGQVCHAVPSESQNLASLFSFSLLR